MTKEDFNELTLEKQIEYFNNQLALGKKASQINKELGFNESTTRKKFAKNGYKLNDDKTKYILKDDDSHISVIKPKEISKVDDRCITKDNDDHNDTNVIIKSDNNSTLVINDKLKENLLDLAESYSDIKKIIEWFKNRDDSNHTNVIEVIQGITIDLPDKETARTTIRINKTIWEEFGEFCDDNSHLDKQDLHSMALKEYMDNHKR